MAITTVLPSAAAQSGPNGVGAKPAVPSDLVGGGHGPIHGETLPNGVRMIIAERPGATRVKVKVGSGAGSIEDPQGKLGLAHLVEHLAFEGSPTMSSAKQERLRTELGYDWNASTDRGQTVYYGVVPNRDAARGASLLTDMYAHPATTGDRVPQERAAVKNEMIAGDGSMAGEMWHVEERMLHGDVPVTNNVIGTKASVNSMTGADIKRFHETYYTGRNTVALVEGDPKHLPLDLLRTQLGALPPGARIDHSGMEVPFVKGAAVQVVPDRELGKVDVTLNLPVSAEQLKRAKVDPKLLLSSLSSVLFERMRRNHDLTYGPRVELLPSEVAEDDGQVLRINAAVAPGNLRAAVRDLVHTLDDVRSGFGPKTFELHKQQELSNLVMTEPERPPVQTVSEHAEEIFTTTLGANGLEITDPEKRPSQREVERLHRNETRRMQRATYEDFVATADSLIDLSNLKLVALGPTDAEVMLAGIKDAKVAVGRIDVNPVDLSLYKEMGLVP